MRQPAADIPRLLLTTIGLLCLLAMPMRGEDTSVETEASLPGVEVATSVDRVEMYIGDLITYTLTITYDSSFQLLPPPLGANLGAFDVKDYRPDEETRLPEGRIQSQTFFTLSTFTTGEYIIPPVPVVFILPDSTRRAVLSEAVPITVLSLLEGAADTLDIKGLKEPYEFPRDMTLYYIGGAVLLVLAIVAVIVIRYLRRRRRRQRAVVDLRPPWEIAFERLAVLKEKRHIEEGRFKAFYIELTELTRAYLGRMYQVDMLEMTTEEFVLAGTEMALPDGMYLRTIDFLKHADLVKFAKLVPGPERTEDDYLFGHDLIESVRADYERRRQAEIHFSAGQTETGEAASGGGR
jgi:hypothetical protein